jgi:hypothetical protein
VIAPSLIPTKPGASTRNCEAASNARRTSTTKQRGFPAPPSAARYRRLDKLLLIEAATPVSCHRRAKPSCGRGSSRQRPCSA